MCVCSKSLNSCKKRNRTRDVLLHRKSPQVWAWIACCFHKLLRTKLTKTISVNWAFAKLAKLYLERPLMLSLAYIYMTRISFNKHYFLSFMLAGSTFVALAEDMKNTYAPYCRHHDDVIAVMEKVGVFLLLFPWQQQ